MRRLCPTLTIAMLLFDPTVTQKKSSVGGGQRPQPPNAAQEAISKPAHKKRERSDRTRSTPTTNAKLKLLTHGTAYCSQRSHHSILVVRLTRELRNARPTHTGRPLVEWC